MMSKFKKRMLIGFIGVLWALFLSAGFLALANYSSVPGTSGEVPAAWPQDNGLVLDSKRPTLVMLVHPLCGCSRASLAELALLMARTQNAARAYAIFSFPDSHRQEVENSVLWNEAKGIPGVEVILDGHESLSRSFGGLTSGHVLVFAATGKNLFSGGITVARGHEGDSQGLLQAQQAIIKGTNWQGMSTPVFGCSLISEPLKKWREYFSWKI